MITLSWVGDCNIVDDYDEKGGEINIVDDKVCSDDDELALVRGGEVDDNEDNDVCDDHDNDDNHDDKVCIVQRWWWQVSVGEEGCEPYLVRAWGSDEHRRTHLSARVQYKHTTQLRQHIHFNKHIR